MTNTQMSETPGLDLAKISDTLRPDAGGIWTTAEKAAEVSFPEDGHAACLQIEDTSFWFRHRNRCLLEILKKYPPEGTLLEIGGGNGFVCQGLQTHHFQTVLMEPVRAGAENARSRGLNPVVCSTLEAARFRSGSIPAAGIFDVLEHVDRPELFLEEIHRVLINNGRLYMTVPAYQWLWSDVDVSAGHYRRYTLKSIERELSASGFQVEYATYFFAALVPPVFLFRSLPYKVNKKANREEAAAEQHSSEGILAKALQKALEAELSWLRGGRGLALGSSCLVVARKR